MKNVVIGTAVGLFFSLLGCVAYSTLTTNSTVGIVEPATWRIDKTPEGINLTLYTEIMSANQYDKLYTYLDDMPSKSTVTINNAGYGGDVDSMIRLAYGLTSHNKHVKVHLIGNVYSAHAMLSCLAGKNLTMEPMTLLMFHGIQTGDSNHAYILNKLLTVPYMQQNCRHLLSDKEIAMVGVNGQELYITKELAIKRMNDPNGSWHQTSTEGVFQLPQSNISINVNKDAPIKVCPVKKERIHI